MYHVKFLFCFLLFYSFTGSHAQVKQVSYSIKPVPSADRVNLEIEFDLRGVPDGSNLLSLLMAIAGGTNKLMRRFPYLPIAIHLSKKRAVSNADLQ